ncbi:MAG: SGNH/GDSL hydrolase family protein [Lachnospiraceae bacterium]|nr:SGNH/GDSL hydrolase family protein [Lachnospiraceae bacterium]
MMKVLCYGDSNTYGFNPVSGLRYPKSIRWTGRLQQKLGGHYEVIEEGCNGRTTVFEDPFEPWKNGMSYLYACLNSHKPIDIVTLMLGSNDLKTVYHASAEEIARGAEELVCAMQSFMMEKQGFCPKIILMAPPVIGEDIERSPFGMSFDKSAVERSKNFGELYRKAAERQKCYFFNTADYIQSSKEDCLHLTPESHAVLADNLARYILAIE